MGVEEEQGREGLVLRRGCHLPLDGQMGQESPYVGFVEFKRVPGAVVEHEASRPADVGFFRAEAEVLRAAGPAHLIEQFHRRWRCFFW